MVETFYLHLEFKAKTAWSINLPFLCTKCGKCCTLDDFLTAGKVGGTPQEHPETHVKAKAVYEELGAMWAANETNYDQYITHTQCLFLQNNSCSIYEVRPEGCRQFPNTTFGMQSQDCPALTRFKKMCSALKKGRITKEKFYFVGKATGLTECGEPIKPATFTEKQYQTCLARLHKSGITEEELILFNCFNAHKSHEST